MQLSYFALYKCIWEDFHTFQTIYIYFQKRIQLAIARSLGSSSQEEREQQSGTDADDAELQRAIQLSLAESANAPPNRSNPSSNKPIKDCAVS